MLIKTKACAIMQPTYLPWLGYFDLIANVRDFLFLDDVKFNKSSYHHQNKILGPNGDILLSIPTHAVKGRMGSMINDVGIDSTKRWQKKHLKSIQQSYKKAPFYDQIYQYVESVLLSDIEKLSDLNIEIIKLFSSMLSLRTNFHVASNLKNISKDRVRRLIDFCQIKDCNFYYSPLGSLDYLDTTENKELFNDANIVVYFQKYELIPYMQNQKQKEFVPYMSILDVLMNCGIESTKNLLTRGRHMSIFE
ncbi:WbqC family protein [Woeseiaceae bacterium]|jgi:hypothetical protein|nr:WbqC family protein [Woeseiaceae bacterium]